MEFLITELYNYYMKNINELPENYFKFIKQRGETPERVVCDYIAGMSDQYSVARFQEIFIPKAWKGWVNNVISRRDYRRNKI